MSHRDRLRVAFVVVAAVVAAGCGEGHMSLRPDQSTAVGSGAVERPLGGLFAGSDAIRETAATGAIESITPETHASGTSGTRVVIGGEAEEATRSFVVVVPDYVPMPFAVGDTVSLSVVTLPGPPTWQPMDIVVTDAEGGLLMMYGVTAPNGWELKVAGEAESVDRGDYRDVERYVSLTHAGQTAVTHHGRWRRLDTPDGRWFVAASASDVEGDALPPDGGPAHGVMIVRGERR